MQAPAQPSQIITSTARYALLLCALTQAVSLLDRQILAILAPAIKADLGVGDAEMGLLYGTVFGLFYALFSLPLGRLADGWSRVKLLSISLAFWSGATAFGAGATGFAMLAASRLGVGIGEASSQPAGTSLLYDYWPKHRRGFVMAALSSAISLGIGGSLVLGGVAAAWWSAAYPGSTAPLGLRGWQFAFLVASAPGFVLSAFMWRLREPERGAMDGISTPPDPAPFRASWKVFSAVLPGFGWLTMLRDKASAGQWGTNLGIAGLIVAAMWWLYRFCSDFAPRPPLDFGLFSISPHALQWGVIGFGLIALLNMIQNMARSDPQAYRVMARSPTLIMCMAVGSLQSVINYGMMGFNPSFLMRTYSLSAQDTALQFGLLSAASGIIGHLIWGILADWLQVRLPGKGRAWVSLFAMGVSPVMALWVYHAPDPTSFYLRFIPYSLILTGWLPPLYAIMYEQVLPRMRAVMGSVYLLTATITGLGIGPYLVGLISDGTGDLRFAMLSINLVGIPIVLMMLAIAGRAHRDETALLERAA